MQGYAVTMVDWLTCPVSAYGGKYDSWLAGKAGRATADSSAKASLGWRAGCLRAPDDDLLPGLVPGRAYPDTQLQLDERNKA